MRRVVAACSLLGLQALTISADASDIEACVVAAEKGQASRRSHSLVEARTYFIECSQLGCPPLIQADCASWLADVEARTPTAAVRVTSEDGRDLAATLLVDGEKAETYGPGRAMRFDPGVRTLRVEASGYEPDEQQVVFTEGEKARVITFELRRQRALDALEELPRENHADAPRRKKVSPFVYPLAGIGVAAAGSFGYFGLTGRAEASDLRSGCGATASCTDAQVDSARAKYIAADISLVVALVALGGATVLWLSSR
jgi:hypothetical protein